MVRAEYVPYIIKTTDGQALTGLIAEQSAGSVTLKNANNQRVTVERLDLRSDCRPRAAIVDDIVGAREALSARQLRRHDCTDGRGKQAAAHDHPPDLQLFWAIDDEHTSDAR